MSIKKIKSDNILHTICIIDVRRPIIIFVVDAMTRMSNDLLPFEYNETKTEEVEHVVAIATAVDKS